MPRWQTADGDYLDITGSRAGNFGLLNQRARMCTSAPSVLGSGAKFACIRHLRHVRFRIPDRGAAEGKVEMFISQKDGRMSRILTIGAAQLGPTQRRRDRASLVQRLRDLWVILHD
jgi:hypothetical protein